MYEYDHRCLTQDDFMKRTKFKFPEVDFSKSIYKGINEKVEVHCKHGTSWATPASIFAGHFPCRFCRAEKVKATRETHKDMDATGTDGGFKVGHFMNPLFIENESDLLNTIKVKQGTVVRYKCKICGMEHTKTISQLNRKFTCTVSSKSITFDKDHPFEIKNPEDLKKAKSGWHVRYFCKKCGEYHIKKKYTNMTLSCIRGKKSPLPNKEKEIVAAKVNSTVSYKFRSITIDELKNVKPGEFVSLNGCLIQKVM